MIDILLFPLPCELKLFKPAYILLNGLKRTLYCMMNYFHLVNILLYNKLIVNERSEQEINRVKELLKLKDQQIFASPRKLKQ